ncbi:IS66-like element accessory protein TnpA [Novosphingobium olei]|uniref:Transposase n=1 Tax=Novosphingobium olei TaxID=2728851 RepID=A0A7Y0GCT2_9SPHN|nr:transposase [Novosphingobium olei]NML96324.1 transposase [Novosphingobium olei]
MAYDFTDESNRDLTCASHSAATDLTGDAMVVRRRHERWPNEERARITAESFSPGVSVSQVARRNGVSLGLLHYWRRQVRASGAVEELRFVPVAVAQPVACGSGRLELTIGDVTVRIDGDVAVHRLRAVLEAIRG